MIVIVFKGLGRGSVGGVDKRISVSENGHERRRIPAQVVVGSIYQNSLTLAGRYHALEYLLMSLYGVSEDISEQEMSWSLVEVINADE